MNMLKRFNKSSILPLQNRELDSRIKRLKGRITPGAHPIFLERSLLYIESFRENEDEPTVIKRAKALENILKKITITIQPDEAIVGGRTPLPKMGVPATEGDVEWLLKEIDTISKRKQEPFLIKDDDKKLYIEKIYPYFESKTLKKWIDLNLPEEVKVAQDSKVFSLNQTTHSQGHILPDVSKWLKVGISGLIEEVKTKLTSKINNKEPFYRAVLITLKAANTFINRYSMLAYEMGLTEVAERCKRVSYDPPESFIDAVQSLWFLFVILHLESIGSSFSPGRLDQILFPYYKRDIEKGNLTPEKALDTIEELYIKFNGVVLLRSAEAAKYFAGFPIGFNVALGGQNEIGEDATNELSYLFLKAQADLLLPQPNLSVRLHSKSPDSFLEAVSYVISKGSGMPQIFNDEIVIPALLNRGITVEDARNYAIIGCVEIGIPGKYLGLSDAALFNLPRLFELTMYENNYKSFKEFSSALEENLKKYIRLMVDGCNLVDKAHATLLPTPFLSSVIYNCLDKGMDVSEGGAYYNFTGPQGIGIANIADSIFALKKLVFEKIWEDVKMDYAKFCSILKNNFKDNEMLRYRLMNRLPKFGNNNRDVDWHAFDWSRKYNQEVEKYKNPRGGNFQPGLYTVSAHVPLGMNVGATPDGRKAFEPLADGGLSPMRGRDIHGPLAVLKSVSRIDQIRASNGALLNMKFHPSVFEGDGGFGKFSQFLKGFVAYKNIHIQFNIISADILREAQKNPEAYRDLVVRVAGYSAFFVELNEALQEDIIRRTEHGL